MSYIVTIKITGNLEVFKKALADRGDEFAAIATSAKPLGALHHAFAVGEDYVYVIDEWETVEAFQAFFGDPKMMEFVGSVGADLSIPPEITIGELIDSPDRY